jgi:polyhydroxyalkanoate synthesis regulator phasin
VRDEIRRIALFASGVGDLTRNRAEQIAKELVKSGEVRRDQAAGWAKTLFDASAENRQEIIRFIRTEMQHQVQALGLATTKDLERLEHRLDRVEATSRRMTAKSTVAKKTAAKKAVAKKTTAVKSPGERRFPRKPPPGSESTGGDSHPPPPPPPSSGKRPPPPPSTAEGGAADTSHGRQNDE